MKAKTFSVWACYANKADELYASGLSEADADLVATECNLVADELDENPADYRVAPDA